MQVAIEYAEALGCHLSRLKGGGVAILGGKIAAVWRNDSPENDIVEQLREFAQRNDGLPMLCWPAPERTRPYSWGCNPGSLRACSVSISIRKCQRSEPRLFEACAPI